MVCSSNDDRLFEKLPETFEKWFETFDTCWIADYGS